MRPIPLFRILTALGLIAFAFSGCSSEPTVPPWQSAFGNQVDFSFEDLDPDQGQVSGGVVLTGVTSPTGYDTYEVYWSSSIDETGQLGLLGSKKFTTFVDNPLIQVAENSPLDGDYLLLYITDANGKNRIFTGKAARVKDLVQTDQTKKEGASNSLLEVDKVRFAFDRAEIDAQYQEILDKAFGQQKSPSQIKLKIIGHADSRGSNSYNLALGGHRSQAVKDYLVRVWGLLPDNIHTYSCGEEQPELDGEGESAWSVNRRAVTLIEDSQGWDCSSPL